ncbi:hypothetical protein [Flavobacterium sp. KACC 22763]|uniref:hypothetical protein n=1 Tax=Flavobacterium sp. KACC 22763 TaxID=3025668 RepID=UPI002366E5F8|nr:hypothetical protein [Flavobacterium sp. KACC 22763]WDF65654.1 hypothetical protein PQ463_05675 [Flavobacterium sp. KACC 22763]
MNRTPKTSESQAPKVWLLDFLERYWIIVLAIIFGYPFIKRYIDDQKANYALNDADNEKAMTRVIAENPVTLQEALLKITTRTEVHDIARSIAVAFGTHIQTGDSSFWDKLNPKGWTENDSEAYQQLARIKQPATVELVSRCYYLFTRRDLRKDVRELLDSEYKKKLTLF